MYVHSVNKELENVLKDNRKIHSIALHFLFWTNKLAFNNKDNMLLYQKTGKHTMNLQIF